MADRRVPFAASQARIQSHTGDARNVREVEADADGQETGRGRSASQSQGCSERCWQELGHEWKRSGKIQRDLMSNMFLSAQYHDSSNTTQSGSKTMMMRVKKNGIWRSTGESRRQRTWLRRRSGLLISVYKMEAMDITKMALRVVLTLMSLTRNIGRMCIHPICLMTVRKIQLQGISTLRRFHNPPNSILQRQAVVLPWVVREVHHFVS